MKSPSNGMDQCRAARVPKTALAALAPLRQLTGVQIVEAADEAWIVWEGNMPALIGSLLPASGVVLYRRDEQNWRPIRDALPDFAVPFEGPPVAISRAVLPGKVLPSAPPDQRFGRVDVKLVPSAQPRPVTAIRCVAHRLLCWAEKATSLEIGEVSGAVCGETVWLRGKSLPFLPESARFWGELVLTPVGFRPDPDWPEGPLRQAAQVNDDEILVLSPNGPEALPASAFQPLTRAAVRKLIPFDKAARFP